MPEKTKAGPVPRNDGLGLDQEESVGPTRPELPEGYPEQAIEAVESRARSFPFPDDELLAESYVLQTKPMT